MNICTEFEEPMLIMCQVIIWTRFGLFTNMLTVSVTLTFDRMISKLIGIIYTPIQMSSPNLTNLGQFCVLLSSGQGLVYISIRGVTMTFDLKINGDHLHSETHVCAKSDRPTNGQTDWYEQSNIPLLRRRGGGIINLNPLPHTDDLRWL